MLARLCAECEEMCVNVEKVDGKCESKTGWVGDSVRKGPSHGDHSARTRDMSWVATIFTTHGLTRISHLLIAEHPETSSDICSIFHVVSAPQRTPCSALPLSQSRKPSAPNPASDTQLARRAEGLYKPETLFCNKHHLHFFSC
jgi:hypothetical protein